MKQRFPVALVMTAIAAACTATAFAQSPTVPAGKDWPHITGNLGAQGYTSLTQINKSNIGNLGPAWQTNLASEPITSPAAAPGTTNTGGQSTPIVVNGVMYVNPPGGGVVALNAATGAVKWKWVPSATLNGYGPTSTQRGVSVGEGKVYTTASGNRVVALDQETGAVVWAVQPTDTTGTALSGIAKVPPRYHDGLIIMGTNDNARGAAFALKASDGSTAWVFYSTYPHGTSFTDVNGTTFDAGDTFTTKDTPNDTPNECYRTAGAAPWQQGSIDPELGMLYVAFGNVRSCGGSQNGAGRPGDNLFGSSVVALDYKTGAYKWHFQSVRHDIWDMDNVLTPTLADVQIGGETKKVIFYGSKSAHQFTLDRATGKPVLPIEYRAIGGDSRNNPAPTQPFPLQSIYSEQCMVLQNLGSEVPGHPNRLAPNWNGYQAEPDPANPGQMKLVYRSPNYLSDQEPFLVGPPRKGCLYEGSYDGFVYVYPPSQNGGNDMTVTTMSPKLNMRYVGLSYMPGGHPLQQGGNGLRMIGGYQTGAILGVNNSTGQVVWYEPLKYDLSRQHNPLVTATDLLFHTQMDGWLVGRDAATGKELWRFQMGAPSQTGTISYEVNGEQYIATTNMAGGQPYSQGGNGQSVWAFKIGGKAKYYTGTRADPVYVTGGSEAPAPLPIPNWRRPTDNAAAGIVPDNEVWMARSNGTATSTPDSVATASMIPSQRRVPVGTTVTFRNPGIETFPNSPNQKEHCATQFFEGKFNFRLQPGQTAQYKFDREGEYYYNDCTDPRPVGRIIVTLDAVEQPGALQFVPNVLNLRPANGVFTSVQGLVTATFKLPAGYVLDGMDSVKLKTPLTNELFTPVQAKATSDGKSLVLSFDKALIDSNIPVGDAVPLIVTANFMHEGVQKKLTSTANVRVVK
ncbi:PQQ-binding-like beta-propeller repeat protein [Aquincola sp. MAHUQ-54]|uniref:PQQ-binding-like beta-propeller repeat protein n=1 Tax=Aquincola agrisoli TaxID=3119538 RepID=A0AAW9QJV3_9BURK